MFLRVFALILLMGTPVQAAFVPTIDWIDANTALIGVPVDGTVGTSVFIVDVAHGSILACDALRDLENVVCGSTVHRGVVFGLRGQFSYEGDLSKLTAFKALEGEEPIYFDAENALLYSIGFDSNTGVLRDLVQGIKGLLGMAQDPECISSLRLYDLNGGQRRVGRVETPISCLMPRTPFDSMPVQFGQDIFFLGVSSFDERTKNARLIRIDNKNQISLATEFGNNRVLRIGTAKENRAMVMLIPHGEGDVTYGVLELSKASGGVPAYTELGTIPESSLSLYDAGGSAAYVYRKDDHKLSILNSRGGSTVISLPADFTALALGANPVSGCMLLSNRSLLMVLPKGSDWQLQEMSF